VIATRHRPEALSRCISALANLHDRPEEVIVVDNSAGDPETERITNLAGARYLTASGTGLSGARNEGAAAAAGDIVAFVDDDAVPRPGWLPALFAPFADPKVMAVAGRIVPLDWPGSRGNSTSVADAFDAGPSPRTVDRSSEHWFEATNFGGFGGGGNMAFRRAAFEVWPGFRESLGLGAALPGGEENHAFFELVKRGYRVAYAPTSLVGHPYPNTGPALRAFHARGLVQAAGYATLLFVEEHGYRRRVLKYVFEALTGQTRSWRSASGSLGVRSLPPWLVVANTIRGPIAYMRSRRVGLRNRGRLVVLSPSGGFGYGIERISHAISQTWPGKVQRIDLLRVRNPPARSDGHPHAPAAPSMRRRIAFSAEALVRGLRPSTEVVIAAHVNLLPVASALALLSRAPLVLIAHGTEVWLPMPPWRAALVRRCEWILAPSSYTAHWLAKRATLPESRVTVVPWPIDEAFAEHARAFQQPDAGEPHLLTVSRIVRDHRFKGHFTIARSMPAILERQPTASWIVVGEGGDVQALRALCAELKVLDAVVFTGGISDEELAEIYSRTNVFVMPSFADADATPPVGEGFGLVYAEAAAFGIPSVVAETSGGATDFVVHGETGLAVPANDPSALADAVLRLLEDDKLRARLGQAAHARVLDRHLPGQFRDSIQALLVRSQGRSAD
jgi:glycosyltransferase involved in cell wall biosynthesis/GT2 family glycosyltransferase